MHVLKRALWPVVTVALVAVLGTAVVATFEDTSGPASVVAAKGVSPTAPREDAAARSIEADGPTVETRFTPPRAFARIAASEGTFAASDSILL